MTLDEAIAKAKANGDVQLAEWLRQARGADAAARWYTEKLRDLEDENARLRSCLSDDADNARMIIGENAKLRELVRRCVEYTSQDRCEGCVVKSRCNDGEVDECWQRTEIRKIARELGVDDGTE